MECEKGYGPAELDKRVTIGGTQMELKRPAVVGTIASVAIPIVIWVITKEVISAILVGLLTEAISLSVEILIEINKEHNDIIEKLGMQQALVRDENLRRELLEITKTSIEVLNRVRTDQLFLQWVWEAVANFRRVLVDMSKGDVILSANETILENIDIVRQAQESIKAVSYIDPQVYWTSTPGERFLEENAHVIRDEGVKITRIFLIERQDIPELVDIMTKQSSSGVNVRIVHLDDLMPQRANLCEDYIICDDRIVHKVNFIKGFFQEVLISRDPNYVTKTIKHFSVLLHLSHDFSREISPQ